MDLSNASVWWIAAGVVVAAELATGTFYLLMIALGLAAGALAAHFGSGQPIQLVAAALVGGGATAALALAARRRTPPRRCRQSATATSTSTSASASTLPRGAATARRG